MATTEFSPITDEHSLYILMSSDETPGASELAEFIDEGAHFDEVTIALPSGDVGEPYVAQVLYDGDRPPIRIEMCSAPQRLALVREVSELLDRVPEDAEVNAESVDHARGTLPSMRQILRLVVDRETLTEEAWEMLDCLEAYLASKYSGLVYAPGDGLFDAKLQPIVRRLIR